MSTPSAAYHAFFGRLVEDTDLRDAAVAWIDEEVGFESNIDRIDTTHTLDHQRGRVATLRKLRKRIVDLDRVKQPEGGTPP